VERQQLDRVDAELDEVRDLVDEAEVRARLRDARRRLWIVTRALLCCYVKARAARACAPAVAVRG